MLKFGIKNNDKLQLGQGLIIGARYIYNNKALIAPLTATVTTAVVEMTNLVLNGETTLPLAINDVDLMLDKEPHGSSSINSSKPKINNNISELNNKKINDNISELNEQKNIKKIKLNNFDFPELTLSESLTKTYPLKYQAEVDSKIINSYFTLKLDDLSSKDLSKLVLEINTVVKVLHVLAIRENQYLPSIAEIKQKYDYISMVKTIIRDKLANSNEYNEWANNLKIQQKNTIELLEKNYPNDIMLKGIKLNLIEPNINPINNILDNNENNVDNNENNVDNNRKISLPKIDFTLPNVDYNIEEILLKNRQKELEAEKLKSNYSEAVSQYINEHEGALNNIINGLPDTNLTSTDLMWEQRKEYERQLRQLKIVKDKLQLDVADNALEKIIYESKKEEEELNKKLNNISMRAKLLVDKYAEEIIPKAEKLISSISSYIKEMKESRNGKIALSFGISLTTLLVIFKYNKNISQILGFLPSIISKKTVTDAVIENAQNIAAKSVKEAGKLYNGMSKDEKTATTVGVLTVGIAAKALKMLRR